MKALVAADIGKAVCFGAKCIVARIHGVKGESTIAVGFCSGNLGGSSRKVNNGSCDGLPLWVRNASVQLRTLAEDQNRSKQQKDVGLLR